MEKTKWEKLEEAYKREKDPRVVTQMLAVYMVHVRKKSRRNRHGSYAISKMGSRLVEAF